MLPDDQLEENDSNAEDVGCWVAFVFQFHEFLGCNIAECSFSFVREFVILIENWQTEVGQFVFSRVDQNVLGFQVLMQYFSIVQHFVSLNNLIEDVEDLLLRKVFLLPHQVK